MFLSSFIAIKTMFNRNSLYRMEVQRNIVQLRANWIDMNSNNNGKEWDLLKNARSTINGDLQFVMFYNDNIVDDKKANKTVTMQKYYPFLDFNLQRYVRSYLSLIWL